MVDCISCIAERPFGSLNACPHLHRSEDILSVMWSWYNMDPSEQAFSGVSVQSLDVLLTHWRKRPEAGDKLTAPAAVPHP